MSFSAGPNPSDVAVADFNGDGKLDLVTANGNQNSVSVLLGNGDGTFQTAHNFAAGNSAVSVAVGDFNGDGIPDLAVADNGLFGDNGNFGNGTTVSVLLGKGDGTFQPAQSFSAGNEPISVAVGDFNGDGKQDLVVADQGGPFLSVLLGKGDGTFQAPHLFSAGDIPQFVTVGHFDGRLYPNGQPILDLAVASNQDSVNVLMGNGDGTFQTPHVYFDPFTPYSVAVGDFNGDHKLDLVSNNLNLRLGNGDGTFQEAQNLNKLGTTSMAVGDLNGDNNLDLVLAGGGSVTVLLGNGDGTFQTSPNFATGVSPNSVALGDFNGDGKPDVVTASTITGEVSILLNQFVTTTTLNGPASSTYAQPVTYTATVTSGGAPETAGTVTFLDGTTPISTALPLDANGQASFTIASLNAGSHTITASYSGTPGGAGTTGFGASIGTAPLTVNPAPLSASAVNFAATAGAPFTGAIATFTNADPFGDATSYTAIIDWGDGSTSDGAISGTGILTVSGPHTYAAAGSYAISVQISHNLGDTTTATVYPTATVTNLGQAVQDGLTGGSGFWNNKNGQRLIDSFNGGPDSTALSTWLATTFPNLYGADEGIYDLTGASNTQVAAFYQSLFALPGSNLQADMLATALNVYATTQSLGGTAAETYGFQVTATGLGADSFNVGTDGAAFGVANNTILNVYELLEAVSQQAFNNVGTTLQKEANDLFDALNKAGAIS
jgi:hypothetical protein